MMWCLFKHRDNSTFTLQFYFIKFVKDTKFSAVFQCQFLLHLEDSRSRRSSVCTVTRLQAGRTEYDSCQEQ